RSAYIRLKIFWRTLRNQLGKLPRSWGLLRRFTCRNRLSLQTQGIRLAMAERPDWQPISRLSLIGSMFDAMLQDAEEHYQTLLQASPKPHVLDDYIVGRVFEVFGTWLFE